MNISINWLKKFTLAYLTLPVILFLFGWVKLWIAIPAVIALVFGVYWYLERLGKSEIVSFKPFHLILISFLVFWWVSYSGIGGFGILLHDHHKMYSIAKDIMENGTPVAYHLDGKDYFLSSYIGYPLIAPMLAGWISYDAVNIFLFLFASLGVLLGILWFSIISGLKDFWVVIVFALIGGIDFAGYLLQHGGETGFFQRLFGENSITLFWSNNLSLEKYLLYHNNTNVLFWNPPHAIPCWLASGIFFYDLLDGKDIKSSAVYLFPLVLWSPFMLLGLFPFYFYRVIKEGILPFLKVENFLILPAFFLVTWFVNSVQVTDLDQGFYFLPLLNWQNVYNNIFGLIWFLFFEVLVWILPVILVNRNEKRETKELIWLLLAILVLIPLYKLGKFNDWVQRVSMPSLFLLWVMVVRSYLATSKVWLKGLIVFLFVLSSFDALGWIFRSVEGQNFGFKYKPMKYEDILSTPSSSLENGWPVEQILAPADASFFKYVAKQKE